MIFNLQYFVKSNLNKYCKDGLHYGGTYFVLTILIKYTEMYQFTKNYFQILKDIFVQMKREETDEEMYNVIAIYERAYIPN